MSLALTFTLVNFVIGMIIAIILALTISSDPTLVDETNLGLTGIPPLQALMLYPFIYAISGFVAGYVVGYIYNLSARATGGIAIELVEFTPEKRNKKDKKVNDKN